ncbi:MAG: aspartyl-tRNA(Asn)/glutamyl-tRNA(Gln) amidotransferase subunit C [Candidatus Pseudothioglobus sp.]|jgi:aspartyl-tRNA(Asn)/glutamyl-tRNA(Gln) amidotransferase subunit C
MTQHEGPRTTGPSANNQATRHVDEAIVLTVAELSQLHIDTGDIHRCVQEMTQVLALVEQMRDVDTTDVEPMSHPFDTRQTLRADEVTEADQRASFQAIAPETSAGFYLVPRVVE